MNATIRHSQLVIYKLYIQNKRIIIIIINYQIYLQFNFVKMLRK